MLPLPPTNSFINGIKSNQKNQWTHFKNQETILGNQNTLTSLEAMNYYFQSEYRFKKGNFFLWEGAKRYGLGVFLITWRRLVG
jgi:hypothetical protein